MWIHEKEFTTEAVAGRFEAVTVWLAKSVLSCKRSHFLTVMGAVNPMTCRKALLGRYHTAALFLLISPLSGLVWAGSDPQGVPNFHKVNDSLYRGAQPTREGLGSLAKLGVKTVIDLRGEGRRSQSEEQAAKAAGMRYISLPLDGFRAPTAEEMSKVLGLLGDSSAWPAFVHCRRGADRTGTVIACYRIMHDRWTNEKALEEAKSYGMSRLERAMAHYVLNYEPTSVRAASASNSNSALATR